MYSLIALKILYIALALGIGLWGVNALDEWRTATSVEFLFKVFTTLFLGAFVGFIIAITILG